MTKVKNKDEENSSWCEDEVAGWTGVPTNQSVSLGSPLLLRIFYIQQCKPLLMSKRLAMII
jgi:hypothetical protein